MDLSNSLRYSTRLFLWLVAYSAIMTGAVLFFQYSREKEFKAESLNAQLQAENERIIEIIESAGFDPARLDAEVKKDMRLSVIDDSGKMIYDNTLIQLPAANHLHREEIAKAKRSGSGFALRRHSESTGDTYFYSARKSRDGLIVRTAAPYSVSLDALLKADKGFIWFMAALTITMCSLGYFATRSVGQNIRRLKRFAENAERGERIYDTQPFPHDELGDISNNIVRLYASLQNANAERDKEHAAALHEQKEKERIKKQLTNNINHELKTPVASIQACLETLSDFPDMDEGKRKDFIERCLASTYRLRQLLADVSLITRMEDGSTAIDKETLDLSEIIDSVAEERKEAASEKGITISSEVSRHIEIEGNRHLIESIFFNLIDNAIAYSGGTMISIRMEQTRGHQTVITVSDDGCGVEEKHLNRLFERFYRIDKGRSRAAGGTGLGLSIVKNAVAFHNGSIRVENRQAGGLVFTITLPVSNT